MEFSHNFCMCPKGWFSEIWLQLCSGFWFTIHMQGQQKITRLLHCKKIKEPVIGHLITLLYSEFNFETVGRSTYHLTVN